MFRNGNRMPVSASVPNPHFCYTLDRPAISSTDMELVSAAVRNRVDQDGIEAGEIALLMRQDLNSDEAALAFDRIDAALRAHVAHPLLGPSRSVMLVCEMAMPHVDPTFAGVAFLSLVLSVGSEPYVIQTVSHYTQDKGVMLDLKKSTLVVDAGDCFVIDPCTPHLAVPIHPSSESLLILFQLELIDQTPEDRAAILQFLPPSKTHSGAPRQLGLAHL